ncbi:34095_t:CDS:2 [Gigaspora margarita]|uniref:34095_t:CDS:1 n=1 Tax=Gigaspora margarita TaxID=4874 RepID=A0ABN7V114_GIGMA|nr:34095_t:CDS:2 [Gigaspora margarita]
MGFEIYANPSSFLLTCKRLTNDELQLFRDGIDRTHIVALAKNILCFTSTLATHISIPDLNPCSLCGKEIYSLASNPSYKEFTLALCRHIFHQKCLEKYLVNGEARCLNKDCNRDIKTFLSPELFKGSQNKPTTSTAEDIATKQVDSENPTPIGEDANAIYMNELGLLGGENLLSKTAEVVKETSDQATSPIEVVSTIPGNSEKLDDSISKVTSGQIQLPTCEKCSKEISLEFTKPTIFFTLQTLMHKKKHTRESSTSTEKSSCKKAKKVSEKKVSSTLKQLIEELLINNPIVGRSSEEIGHTADTRGIFLKLSDRIDSAESKNEDASHDLITSYFDFGEALYNRYKKLKPTYSKDRARALVKREVRKEIPEAKFSDNAFKKRMKRAQKMFKIFNTIGKRKNSTDDTDYVIAEVLKESENLDYENLMMLLQKVEQENIGHECKKHIKLLQDSEKIRFSWKELKSLEEDNLLREKFEKPINWKDQALSNIASIKDIIKDEKTQAHERLIAKLSEVDVKKLTCNNPLTNNVIDLGANYLQILDNDYYVLAGERAGIQKLKKNPLIKNICAEFVKKRGEASNSYKLVLSQSEKVVHNRWIEENYGRKRIARNIADVLLQEVKSNALHKVLRGSKGSKVEIISRLINAVLWRLLLEYDVEVMRGKWQSVASKDQKLQHNSNARGDRPDLMIQAFLCQKWDEIAYVESGK